MARKSKGVATKPLLVSVDACRVRVQTGEPILFMDARKTEHRAASGLQIAGSLRLPPEVIPSPPCHKHNFIVVYCG